MKGKCNELWVRGMAAIQIDFLPFTQMSNSKKPTRIGKKCNGLNFFSDERVT